MKLIVSMINDVSPQFCCVRNTVRWLGVLSQCGFINFKNKMECMSSVTSKHDFPESLDIKTFVFFDTETTGLPAEEHNKTKITELSLVAVQADHIRLGVFPRVQNKLTLCFNPRKMVSIDSEKITGLSNELLENQTSFTSETVELINGFLSRNLSPVCLVAHNGYKFDYPLLKAEINKTKSTLVDVFCIDSLVAFQQFHLEEQDGIKESSDCIDSSSPIELTNESDKVLMTSSQKLDDNYLNIINEIQKKNETTPKKQMISSTSNMVTKKRKLNVVPLNFNFGISFKLGDVYSRLTKRSPLDAHNAESDVIMLMTCAATMSDKFVDWCNKYAKKFSDTPAMTPGRKIGT